MVVFCCRFVFVYMIRVFLHARLCFTTVKIIMWTYFLLLYLSSSDSYVIFVLTIEFLHVVHASRNFLNNTHILHGSPSQATRWHTRTHACTDASYMPTLVNENDMKTSEQRI